MLRRGKNTAPFGRATARGAVLVESAVFFSAFVIIFFAIFDLSQGLYEFNVVTEAARHGARSLAARTTVDKLCPGDIALAQTTICDSLNDNNPNTDTTANTALGSACMYLEGAGYTRSHFTVTASISADSFTSYSESGMNFTNQRLPSDYATAGMGGGVVDSLQFLTVTAARTSGNSCTICWLSGLLRPTASVTVPLNPWVLSGNKSGIGFSRGCSS
ncbi:MAG: pilus assembly protein [Proteobacteria bacterium]|nr:pilus assembly protein [Pseudomonadota bacterium]